MYPRRPYLMPPDYHIEPKDLFDGYIEQPIRFAGIIPSIPGYVDVTNRTDVLNIIDGGKKHIQHRLDGMLSLCVYHMKITRRGESSMNEFLLRIHTHEIAATCYVKDDGAHILAIKYGTPENCNMAVLYCDRQAIAEEICALTDQCFQLVYAETLSQVIYNVAGSSPSSSESVTINSPSNYFLGSAPKRPNDSIISTESRSTIITKLLKNYVKMLNTKLDMEELQKFAELTHHMFSRKTPPSSTAGGPTETFQDICESIYKLYGYDRRSLMAGMYPFIPEVHAKEFEDFLRKHDINNEVFPISRRHSDTSSNVPNADSGNSDEFDRCFEMISHQIESMGKTGDSRLSLS